QIHDKIKEIVHHANKEQELRCQILVGGIKKMRATQKLKNPPQIRVGTPGTILHMVDPEALSIYSATHVIIDEADLMHDIRLIESFNYLSVLANPYILPLVSSPTIPLSCAHFKKQYLWSCLFVKVEASLLPVSIEHRLIHLNHRKRIDWINEFSKIFQPSL